jgi:hypothetical protein
MTGIRRNGLAPAHRILMTYSLFASVLVVVITFSDHVWAVSPNSSTPLFKYPTASPAGARSRDSADVDAPIGGVNVREIVNVRAFGAKGDCLTDDHNAIQRAINYAYDHGSPPALNSNGLAVYFPAAPGGCYLTSSLTWLGVPLVGDPGNGSQAVTGHNPAAIKGLPGQDVFLASEPTVPTTRPPAASQSLTDLEILVDDSVDSSMRFNPPRRPGRTVDDGIIRAGDNVLSSEKAEFSAGDFGQAIQIIGAGSDSCAPLHGSNCLNTYITGPAGGPGGPITTVTLAGRATATLSTRETFYISVAGIPVAQSIGNCAFAFPDSDGNTANWSPNRRGRDISRSSRWEQIAIRSVTHNDQGHNNTCSFFFQGSMVPYHVRWSNFDLRGTYYGFIATTSTLNPTSLSTGQGLGNNNKFDTWEFNNTFPWITYNGEAQTLENFEVQSSNGLQILEAYRGAGSPANSWFIDTPDVEPRGSGTGSGNFRLEGTGHLVVRSQLGPSTLAPIQWDASGSMCLMCTVNSRRFLLEGNCNTLTIVNPNSHSTAFADSSGTNIVRGVSNGPICPPITWTGAHPQRRPCVPAAPTTTREWPFADPEEWAP